MQLSTANTATLRLGANGGTGVIRPIVGQGATGATGPAGPAGAAGGSDASFAGWINDGTSATRAALRANNYVNVKDPAYGATGNGTTDDTTAIQAAITAAAAFTRGATVFFPTGVYLISASLSIPSSLRLLGESVSYRATEISQAGGGGSVLKSAASGFHMIVNSTTVTGNMGIRVEGLRFDQTAVTTGDFDIIHLVKVWRCRILGCSFFSGSTTNRRGISITGASEQNKIRECSFEGCGIYEQNSNALHIVDCEIGSGEVNVTGTGFYNKVLNTHIYSSTSHGIIWANQFEGEVSGCQIELAGGHGIYLPRGSKRNNIDKNIVKNCTSSGIVLDSDTASQPTAENRVTNNWCGNTSGTPQDYGIAIISGSGSQTNDNVLRGNQLIGNGTGPLQVAAGLRNDIALDARDFGAIGDGSTDNRLAFTTLLTAASALGGGIVTVPEGTFKIVLTAGVGSLTIPTKTTLRGKKRDATVLLFDSSVSTDYHSLIVNGGAGVAVEDLTVRRNSDFQSVVFPVSAYDGFRLERVTIDGQRDTFTTNYCHGVQTGLTGTTANIKIIGCKFTKLSFGLFQQNAATGTVNGIHVDDSEFTGNYDTDLEFNSPNATQTDVDVLGCKFRNNQATASGSGFGVGLAHITRATVQDCSFSGYANEPIHVEDFSTQVLIEGNKFDTCATTRASYVQVISGVSNMTISNNHIDATANSNFPTVINILQGGVGTTPGGRTSIPPVAVTVSDNDVLAGGCNGIYLEATNSCVVSNNRLRGSSTVSGGVFSGGNGGWGIQLYDGVDAVVTGNLVRGFGAAFRHRTDTILAGGQGFTITGNLVTSCQYGISMVNTGSGTISGNTIRNCIRPMITGTGGVAAYPVVVTGNHAYGNTYAMEIGGKLVVIANGAASIGSGVTLTVQALALKLPSGSVVTFSGGGVLTTTADAFVGATSITGNLTTANVASGQTATVTGIAHSTVAGQNHITNSGNGDSVANTY